MPNPTPMSPTTPETLAFAAEAARLLSDLKCVDVRARDLLGKSPVAEGFLIATGTSDRQMRSVIDDLAELGTAHDYPLLRKSEDDRATWIVADFGTVVAHVFEPNTRAFYDLELLWGDSKHIEWQRSSSEAQPS